MTSSAHNTQRLRTASRKQANGDDRANGALHKTNIKASYNIQKVEPSARTLPIHSLFGTFIHALVCVGWPVYLSLRLYVCLRAGTTSSVTQWGLWLLLICEIILAGPDLFQILELSLSFLPSKVPAPRPVYRLNGNDAPLIHVFITYASLLNW